MRWTFLPPRSMPWRRRMAEYAIVIPIIYLLYLAALYFAQTSLMFPRDLAGPGRPIGSLPRAVESLWIEPTPGLRVEAWYLPPRNPDSAHPAPAVIFFHGNAELIDSALDHAAAWRDRGYAVLLPEFRGYGRSGGEPGQRDLVADAAAFYDTLVARPEIDRSRILLHGRSIGAGVAVQLAAIRPAAALVLESAFTSAASFAWRMGAPPILCSSPFRTDRVLPSLRIPVMILHGAQDGIIPVAHGRRLHALAPGSAYTELDGGHNDFPRDEVAYWSAIDRFLRSHQLPAAAE